MSASARPPRRKHVEPEDCPQRHLHTRTPADYRSCLNWMEEKSKTHRQIQCDGCMTWSIWVPKEKQSNG